MRRDKKPSGKRSVENKKKAALHDDPFHGSKMEVTGLEPVTP